MKVFGASKAGLKIYKGRSKKCHQCGHVFEKGEIICVSKSGGLTFCYNGPKNPRDCVKAFVWEMVFQDYCSCEEVHKEMVENSGIIPH